MAVVDSSSGRKNTVDIMARLRCRPADHTPSSSASGVWISQESRVSRKVTLSPLSASGSSGSARQFSRPAHCGEPCPFHRVRLR